MHTSLSCPKCSASNTPGARFCTSCGNGLGGQTCTACGAQHKGGQFCTQCGATTAKPTVQGPGSIAGGKWTRAPGEFVRRVSFEELRGQFDTDLKAEGGFWNMLVNMGQQALNKLQNLYVEIPVGSVAVVMFDGSVTEVLQPGRRPVAGLAKAMMQGLQTTDTASGSIWQRIKGAFTSGAGAAVEQLLSDRLARTSIYLFDTSPIPVRYEQQVTGSSDDHALAVSVEVQAYIGGANDADVHKAYGLFLTRMVGGATSLNVETVRGRLLPNVERLSKDATERFRTAAGPDLAKIQTYVGEQLNADIGIANGLRFTPVVWTRATTLSLRLHLGQAELPDIRPCITAGCNTELKFGQRFCVGCGKEQPTAVSPSRSCTQCDKTVPVGTKSCTGCGTSFVEADPRTLRLLTKDAEPIELDLSLRAQCEREHKDTTRIVGALAATARSVLRGMTYEETRSSDGLRRIEAALVEGVKEALQQLNLQLLGLSVMDCRGRNGEWLLNADAEIRRAEAELYAGKEWLRVDSDRLGLQSATLELVRQRVQLERDDRFLTAEADRAQELRETLLDLAHHFGLDDAELRDAENRQGLSDRKAKIEVADAVRGANVTMSTDAANREAERALRDRQHDDTVTGFDQDLQTEGMQDNRRRTREVDEMGHQIGLEERSAAHDENQTRRNAKLDSDLGRQVVDDAAYVGQVQLDQTFNEDERRLAQSIGRQKTEQEMVLERQKREQEMLLERQQRELDLSIRGVQASSDIEQTAADRESARNLEALKVARQMQADMERMDAEREQTRLRLESEAEQARMRLEAEREKERLGLENERLSGRTGADLIAAQAAMLGKDGAAWAAALAAQTDGSIRTQMQEQMMLRDREMAAQAEAKAELAKAELREIMEKNAAMQNATFKELLQTVTANTASLAGANRASNEQTIDAHRMAAQQAQSMSERTMDTMANVAATASRGPQQVFLDPRTPRPAPQPEPSRSEPPLAQASSTLPCVKPGCGGTLADSERFCQSCGTPRA